MIVPTSAKVGIAGFLKPPLGFPSGGFFVLPSYKPPCLPVFLSSVISGAPVSLAVLVSLMSLTMEDRPVKIKVLAERFQGLPVAKQEFYRTDVTIVRTPLISDTDPLSSDLAGCPAASTYSNTKSVSPSEILSRILRVIRFECFSLFTCFMQVQR